MLHVAAYLVLLLALGAVVDRADGWNLDDGAYATQVRTIALGGADGDAWAYPYEHRDVDPASRFAPVSHATTTADATYPYVKQPAWIEVLRASHEAFGSVGGWYVPSIVGALLAALVGGLLAARLVPGTPGAGPLGFWLVALGPLVVHTQALWAHTAAAALGGAGALALVALAMGRERWWHVVTAGMAVAGLVSVRSEGLLYAAALAATAGIVIARRSAPVRDRAGTAAAWVGTIGVAAVAARLATARWSSHLAPGEPLAEQDTILADVGFVPGRFRGAARTLLDGVGSSQAGTFLALVVVALAVAGGRALARRGWRGPGPVLVGGAVVVVVVRCLAAPDDLGGLLVAVPLLPAGLAAWSRRTAPASEQALVALGGLYLLAVLATQYPEGGSRDWGGRFLFPVLVPIVVVAGLALWRALDQVRPALLATALVALGAIPTVGGLRVAEVARSSNRSLTDLTLSVDAPTVIRVPRYLTRTSWRALPGHDWLSAEPRTASRALALLRPGRTEPVAVVGNGADQVRAAGWRREVRSPVVVVFTPA
jgi:hypothetical protein